MKPTNAENQVKVRYFFFVVIHGRLVGADIVMHSKNYQGSSNGLKSRFLDSLIRAISPRDSLESRLLKDIRR